MSSKCLASSLTLQAERFCSRPVLHHALPITRRSSAAPPTHRSWSRCLSTTPAFRRQEAGPSTTTSSTSSQDANKAAAAEGTGSNAAASSTSSSTAPSRIYSYEEILDHTESPDPKRILIDVREPSELTSTGQIPTAINLPITSSPDAFFLPEQEFEDRFGFPRPAADAEVVFYCKSGVRSRAAARMAGQAGFGGKQGEFPGSWKEWEKRGGRVERV